jgi:hypothetical protein
MANQTITDSQQFTNDLLGQSVLNASIQDDTSYITNPSPVQFTPDLTGQSLLNASIQDDNSYITSPSADPFTPDQTGQFLWNASIQDDNSYNAPPSPTQVDTYSDYVESYEEMAAVSEENVLALADEDMSAGIF